MFTHQYVLYLDKKRGDKCPWELWVFWLSHWCSVVSIFWDVVTCHWVIGAWCQDSNMASSLDIWPLQKTLSWKHQAHIT